MGIFWDLLQQDELEKQKKQANSLEDRVEHLEDELKNTQALLKKTLIAFSAYKVVKIIFFTYFFLKILY